MKQNRNRLVTLGLMAILVVILGACGPADTGPVILTVTGLVDKPLSLTDAGLHKLDAVTLTVEHPKNGMTEYTGVLLSDLLEQAGAQVEGATLVLTASDGYTAEVELAAVLECTDCLVAFTETAGDYVAVLPGQSSKAWVKGLVGIEIK